MNALDKGELLNQLARSCGCSLRCNKVFTIDTIMYWRRQVHYLPEGCERMRKILELLKMATTNAKKFAKKQVFKVEQQYCCRKLFIEGILGVSKRTVCRARLLLLTGKENMYDKPIQMTHAARGKVCKGFIQTYVHSACDRDPTGKTYRMPVSMTRMDLFSLYQTVYPQDHLESSTFYHILKKHFDNVVFSKTQRFTKCKECNNFRTLIENEKNPTLKSKYMALRDCHLKEEQIEREAYYVRRSQAEMRPNEILSVILDGIDQAKTNLPHYAYGNNPIGSGQLKLKTHITGSIMHGRGKYFFLDYNQIPHDTNLTLSCLLKMLLQESNENGLPPTLYVQLDNTCRENKNKYFLGMMAYLVKHQFLREVWMSFLLVGHTHEDIDQCFSRISVKLKSSNTLTLPELHHIISESQTPKPKSVDVGTVWNISAWLEDKINPVHNVTFPKMYRIFCDDTGHVTVQYKERSTDEEWHPTLQEKPLEIFKIVDGEQQLPQGQPEKVKHHLDATDISDLKRSIKNDFHLARFTDEHIERWNTFFDELNSSDDTEEEWPLEAMTQYNGVTMESSMTVKELIERYREKRQEFRQVYTAQTQDRRSYREGEMILYKNEQGGASIGEVLKCNSSTIHIRKYTIQKGRKFVETTEKLDMSIDKCYAGGFCFTPGGFLPLRVKDRIKRENITLV